MGTPIEDYALLGNCRTAALVSRAGSVDWLCFPRFDSPSCFSSLLGSPDNGRWLIAPSETVLETKRAYIEGTLILETVFVTPHGSAKVTDFMAYGTPDNSLVRIVTGLSGHVAFAFELIVRFDYGSAVPWVERYDEHTLTAVAGPDMLVLHTSAKLQGKDLRTIGTFELGPGERETFVLSYQPSNTQPLPPCGADAALAVTHSTWRAFSDRCPQLGSHTAQVKRSLLTLKALTYQPTGGIVAATTTSLPERLGGMRNWDYRYCWLRDATMTLLAFIHLGYLDEADAWYEWLMRTIAGNPEQMQIMYGLAGERRLPELDIPWLAGYEGSKPVRIGNAAAHQRQLDVYGEVADAITRAFRSGLSRHPRGQAIGAVVMPYLEKIWGEPDEGIWEVRGPRRHFTHSKVMAWVAFQRIATLNSERPEQAELARRQQRIADDIHADVCRHGYDPRLGSFVQSYGSTSVDAALLQIALTGFLPAADPRFLGTLELIEKRLLRDGFLYRYDTGEGVDGLPPGEGVFLACSFWLADVYVLLGRQDDARKLYARLCGLCNDVGLLSEEYSPRTGRMLGNFPQAFSHIGIINSALNLYRAQAPAKERSKPL